MNIIKSQTQVKVLVAIDSINLWDNPSAFIHPTTYKYIKSRNLALVNQFNQLTRKPPLNGLTIMSTCSSLGNNNKSQYYLDNTQEYIVHHYTNNEYNNTLLHYSLSNYLVPQVNDELINVIKGISGSVGNDVFKLARAAV